MQSKLFRSACIVFVFIAFTLFGAPIRKRTPKNYITLRFLYKSSKVFRDHRYSAGSSHSIEYERFIKKFYIKGFSPVSLYIAVGRVYEDASKREYINGSMLFYQKYMWDIYMSFRGGIKILNNPFIEFRSFLTFSYTAPVFQYGDVQIKQEGMDIIWGVEPVYKTGSFIFGFDLGINFGSFKDYRSNWLLFGLFGGVGW